MNKGQRILQISFALIVAAATVICVSALLSDKPVETSLLALLPPSDRDKVVETAGNRWAEKTGRTVVFLVRADGQPEAIAAAKQLENGLRARKDLFVNVSGAVSEKRMKDYYDTFFPWRWQVLSSENHRRVTRHLGDEIIQEATDILYSPISGPGGALFKEDPLFLFSNFIRHLPRLSGQFSLEDGYLLNKSNGVFRVLVTATTLEDPFSTGYHRRAVAAIEDLSTNISAGPKNTALLWTGMLKYAHDSASTAQREISVIGVGSMLGIILLLMLTFRSFKVLIVSLLPIVIGLITAYASTLLLTGSVHMLTLVFGSTLLGICIDYSLHYFSDAAFADHSTTHGVLAHIFPGITLGMLTSILGFLCLLIAPFPGLRQMAIFSAVGLFSSWAVVVVLFPLLPLQTPAASRTLPSIVTAYLRMADRPFIRRALPIALVALCAAAIPGIFLLRFDDDIRLLRNTNTTLLQEEKEIASVLGTFDQNRFLLVEGDNEEDLLQREERVVSLLNRLVKEKALENYLAISLLIPSTTRQASDGRKMTALVKSPSARQMADTIGEPELFSSIQRAPFITGRYFKPEHALNRPSFELYRNLWLGRTERGVASMIVLEKIHNPELLKDLVEKSPKTHYTDRIEAISGVFTRFREISTWLVSGAYALILVFLMFRYGPLSGLRVFIPPLFMAIALLGFMGYAGIAANLFTFLALLLTLGISIDYTIFFAESGEFSVSTGTGVVLSSLTTILSFGLLSLSDTPALNAFGTTILLGILIAAGLSPLGRRSETIDPKKTERP